MASSVAPYSPFRSALEVSTRAVESTYPQPVPIKRSFLLSRPSNASQQPHSTQSSFCRTPAKCCSVLTFFNMILPCPRIVPRFSSPPLTIVPRFPPPQSSFLFSRVPLNSSTHTMWGKSNISESKALCTGLCRGKLTTDRDEATITDTDPSGVMEGGGRDGQNGVGEGGDEGGGGSNAITWISSGLMFALLAGLLFYVFTMSPNQTQFRDTYFVEKLVGLFGDDGFPMNRVLVAEWWVMAIWPLIYSSLLIPSGRSDGIKVGPFAVASFFIGAGALLPYFGLWRPPTPRVPSHELGQFPLNILESKFTAVAIIVAGVVLVGFAALGGGEAWTEFIQYTRESRFVHVMSLDFMALSALAPFWVYNDQSFRQGSDKKVTWLVPVSIFPYFGPALYLLLRSPLPFAAIRYGRETRESQETLESEETRESED